MWLMYSDQWRRPGAEFGGTEKIFVDQNFWMTFCPIFDVFSRKNSHFHAQKFWLPFLSHRPGFSYFLLNLFRFSVPLLCKMSYMTFFTRKSTISEKNSLTTPIFLLSSSFRAHLTTLLLKILGGGPMHGPSPTSNFCGDRPPVSPSLILTEDVTSIIIMLHGILNLN